MSNAPHPAVLALLDQATRRLVRSVDELPDGAYAEPSALPGWTRGHLIAHLALNAETLARVLEDTGHGREAAMYPSPQIRDADIDELAPAEPGELRNRFLGSTRTFADAVAAAPERTWSGGFRRVPDAADLLPAPQAIAMRHREVEFHHVDLDVGYRPEDWPLEFAGAAVEALRARAPEVTLLATDLGQTWHADRARVTVNGPAARLAWWLGGRGAGEGLTSNGGDLPTVASW